MNLDEGEAALGGGSGHHLAAGAGMLNSVLKVRENFSRLPATQNHVWIPTGKKKLHKPRRRKNRIKLSFALLLYCKSIVSSFPYFIDLI